MWHWVWFSLEKDIQRWQRMVTENQWCTQPGLQLLHGRVHVLQGLESKVLLLFLLMPTLYQWQASIKAVCKLFFTFCISHCSSFSLEKETALGSHAVCFFENILCFMVFKGVSWYLKLFYDSWCWMYKTTSQLQLSFPRFFEQADLPFRCTKKKHCAFLTDPHRDSKFRMKPV